MEKCLRKDQDRGETQVGSMRAPGLAVEATERGTMTSGSFRIALWLRYEGEARNDRPEYVRLLSSIRAAKESSDNAIGHNEHTEDSSEEGTLRRSA